MQGRVWRVILGKRLKIIRRKDAEAGQKLLLVLFQRPDRRTGYDERPFKVRKSRANPPLKAALCGVEDLYFDNACFCASLRSQVNAGSVVIVNELEMLVQ